MNFLDAIDTSGTGLSAQKAADESHLQQPCQYPDNQHALRGGPIAARMRCSPLFR
jgi:hypothetical protein